MEKYTYSPLGKKLRMLRIQKNITQEELAAYMNVTRQTISAWERDKSEPDLESISTLADYYSVSVDDLPSITLGFLIALFTGASSTALAAIAVSGYSTAIILILLGKRTQCWTT